MTRQKLPDICNFCGKSIESEKQYVSEWFEGRSTFGNERTRAKSHMDCCHKCFTEICSNGYKPNFIAEIKNPNYVAGSKEASKKYFIPKPETDVHIGQDEQKVLA